MEACACRNPSKALVLLVGAAAVTTYSASGLNTLLLGRLLYGLGIGETSTSALLCNI